MTAKKFRMPTPLKSTLNTWPKVLPRAEKSKLMNEVGMTEYMPASGLGKMCIRDSNRASEYKPGMK